MKTRRMLKALLLVLFAAVALFIGGVNTASAAAGDAPAHSKTIEDNGDGTYKIELTVTGDSDDQTEFDSHVNVLIVYDESSSMRNDSPSRADYAEAAMYDFVDGLVGYAARDVDIYAAVVGFGTGSNIRANWTNNLQSVRSLFDEGVGDGYNGSAHGNYGYNGTNWASAMNAAESLLGNGSTQNPGLARLGRENYPTFVIFVTDGGPTTSGGNAFAPSPTTPWTQFEPHYENATADARSIQNGANTTLYGIYAFGTDANLLDDLMYYANTGTHREIGRAHV